MGKDSPYRTSMIGAGEVGCAISVDMDKNFIHTTNSLLWDTKGNDVIGTTALPFYGGFISEDSQLQIIRLP